MAKETTVERERRAFVPNKSWLAKRCARRSSSPSLPIVDPHHHLWERANAATCWTN